MGDTIDPRQQVFDNAAEAVTAAIAVLDQHEPHWRDRVNLDRLEQVSHLDCVLGQVFGRWAAGLDAIDCNEDSAVWHLDDESRKQGRCLLVDTFADFDDEWKRQLGGAS